MKIKTFVFLMSGIALFSSCDKNIGKIEEIAEDFATSVNNNDKVSLYEINPLCRTYKHMNLPSSLSADDLDVEFNEVDSTYLAKYSDNQYLVFKVDGEDAKIIDSYGILSLDSVCYELAAQLGVPVKQKSDLYNAKLFNEDDSRFLNWLKGEYKDAANAYLDVSDGSYTWWNRNASLKIREKITNKGSKPISGDDYVVEYTIKKARGESIKLSYVKGGVDLMPGESSEIYFYKDEAYKWA
jgi:membrane-bound inhibitor of C-type lysozyme